MLEKFSEQTFVLERSTCTDETMKNTLHERLEPRVTVRLPEDEVIPELHEGEVVVFEAFFDVGLGFPTSELLDEVPPPLPLGPAAAIFGHRHPLVHLRMGHDVEGVRRKDGGLRRDA
ncbi:hypothetical protein GUJ93_ZPchr0004g40311 [Zizania palustris]|uniref:Uncharacterized protein n=1 Tax=Zizania palustris TaxID=103762 RepID=A0A8J5S1S2_ZIZPA|nr:hypothetical protein GUJ93_ZPchr0004g40311 [Zizania palustris]